MHILYYYKIEKWSKISFGNMAIHFLQIKMQNISVKYHKNNDAWCEFKYYKIVINKLDNENSLSIKNQF